VWGVSICGVDMKTVVRVCPDIEKVRKAIKSMVKEAAMACKGKKGGGKKK